MFNKELFLTHIQNAPTPQGVEESVVGMNQKSDIDTISDIIGTSSVQRPQPLDEFRVGTSGLTRSPNDIPGIRNFNQVMPHPRLNVRGLPETEVQRLERSDRGARARLSATKPATDVALLHATSGGYSQADINRIHAGQGPKLQSAAAKYDSALDNRIQAAVDLHKEKQRIHVSDKDISDWWKTPDGQKRRRDTAKLKAGVREKFGREVVRPKDEKRGVVTRAGDPERFKKYQGTGVEPVDTPDGRSTYTPQQALGAEMVLAGRGRRAEKQSYGLRPKTDSYRLPPGHPRGAYDYAAIRADLKARGEIA